MTEFVQFRHKSNGVVATYPEHYENHPVFGDDLERYTLGDPSFEEDKVDLEDHNIPVDQRGQVVAVPLDELKVEDLREALRELGEPTSGNKDELIQRLHDYKGEGIDTLHDTNEEI